MCGVGSFTATDSSFWLYKVNHVAPEVGGEQFPLKKGADVLWFFQDTVANRNTGDELAITVPARARTGRSFTVSVSAYAFNGTRKPAAGAQVAFRGGIATTDAAGRATVTINSRGDVRLRATRGADIPSSSEIGVRGQAAQRLCGQARAAPVRHPQRGLPARLSRT